MKKNPKVFIIILNWNQLNDTCVCLDSLKKIAYPNYQIVVVDNGSQDNSLKTIKKKYPMVKIIANSSNLGFVRANNQGIKLALQSKADYILILNNDTIVHPQMLTKLVRKAEEDKKIAIIGPQIYYYDQPQKLWFLRANLSWPLGGIKILNQNKKKSYSKEQLFNSDYITGAAMLIRSEVIQRLGSFDPYFFIYWDDVELSVRYKKGGYKIKALANAVMWHKVSSAATAGEKSCFLMGRNQLYFCRKHNNFFTFWFVVVPIIFFQRLYYLIFSGFNKLTLAGFLGMISFFRGFREKEGLKGI